MSDEKKKRLSMLDGLTAAGPSLAGVSRALRSAREAVEGHQVWELAPEDIEDSRLSDRIDPRDVADLRQSIETNGQAVPVLVRRDPEREGKYLLVYGRRRLEAVRGSSKVRKVRALIAAMDEGSALRAQIAENSARRDLTYIERALFAQELVSSGFGSQTEVAEVLNATKSAISMALGVVRGVGADLVRAIGPAPGIGRPRWEALAEEIGRAGAEGLVELASRVRAQAEANLPLPASGAYGAVEITAPSVSAFEAVMKAVKKAQVTPSDKQAPRKVMVHGREMAQVSRTPRGVRLEILTQDEAFAAWVESRADELVASLVERWRAGD